MVSKPLVILSDIHANLSALEIVYDSIDLPRDQYEIFFLGDLTGYGPTVFQVYNKIKKLNPEIWLAGNHDKALQEESICFSNMNPTAKECIKIHRRNLESNIRTELSNKPEKTINGHYLCSHGFPITGDSSIETYDFEFSPEKKSDQILALWKEHYEKTNIWFVGHSHSQKFWWYDAGGEGWTLFPSKEERYNEKKLTVLKSSAGSKRSIKFSLKKSEIKKDLFIINPGSVGFPRKSYFENLNGHQYANYMILREVDDQMEFEFITCAYSADMVLSLWNASHYPSDLQKQLQGVKNV
ncbi:metallophosphatase family protein [bacterium]|nr:metallophosphatase family protein [candidate division CSSED10-310 bacterium]